MIAFHLVCHLVHAVIIASVCVLDCDIKSSTISVQNQQGRDGSLAEQTLALR